MPFLTNLYILRRWILFAACTVFSAQAAFAQVPSSPAESETEERKGRIVFFNKPGSLKFSNFDDQDGVVIFKAKLEGKEIWALLDTGSNYSLVSESFIEEFSIKTEDTQEIISAESSSQSSRVVSGLTFEHIGQYTMNRQFYTFKLEGMSEALGRRIDVVIGYDLLKQISFVLDGKYKRLLMLPSGMISADSDRYTTVNIRDGVIDGSLNGISTRFAVDLGSNSVLSVYSRAWSRLFGSDRTMYAGLTTDASGVVRAREGLEGAQLEALGFSATVFARRKSGENKNFDALLGYPFFSGRVTIFDYPKNAIYVEKTPRPLK